jgi:hypothetical protein
MQDKALATIALLLFTACGEQADVRLCSDGACPSGTWCDVDLGVCREEPVTPDEVGEVGSHNTVLVDPDGGLVVTTYDRLSRAFVVGRGQDRASMAFAFVDGTGGTGSGSAVEDDVGSSAAALLDEDGLLHAVYYDATRGDIKHATVRGLRLLQIETVDMEHDVGRYASLAAQGGILHAAYHDETDGTLRYARRGPEGWTAVTVPPPLAPACLVGESACSAVEAKADYGRYTSIGLVAGQPVIAHYDGQREDLLLSTLAAGQWTTSRLDGFDPQTGMDTIDVGRWASLVVAPGGSVSVAYYDATNGALRYTFSEKGAQKLLVIDDGLVDDPKSGASRRHVVGQHANLVVSAEGVPTIYYLDATDLGVRAAVRGGDGSWSIGSLPLEGPGGPWLDVARLHDGRLAVVYETFGVSSEQAAPRRDLGLWVGP